MILCPYCHSSKPPRKDGFLNGEQRYLCKDCGIKYTAKSRGFASFVRYAKKSPVERQGRQLKECAFCGRETDNPKFCSSSCAAKYNNIHFPKRKQRIRHCKHCGIVIPAGRTVCDDCNPSLVDWSQRTLKQVRDAAKYQANGQIRGLARDIYTKANLPRVCTNCGYDKYIEVCHIRAVSDFPLDTPVAVINDLSNLIALCPNCHWELDHGLLVWFGNSAE